MRIPVSFDMLDPALCCLEDIKTHIKASQLFVEKSFLWRRFLSLKVYIIFTTHVTSKCISSHFRGLNL